MTAAARLPSLRPVDLARAAGMSTQQVRRYEAGGMIPRAPRSPSGYRLYSQDHLDALLLARQVIAGFGWQTARAALTHLNAGRFERAFAIADRAHLAIHEARRKTLATLGMLQEAPSDVPLPTRRRSLTISDVASHVGVPVSTIRHWQSEGLISSHRDAHNGYHLYTSRHVALLRVIAMLRENRYGIPAVRTVITDLAGGDVHAALNAAQGRLDDINATSLRCAAATAAMWDRYRVMTSPESPVS